MGMVRKRENPAGGSSLVRSRAGKYGVAKPDSSLVDVVKQAARPDEFRVHKTQSENNRRQPRAGPEDHAHSQGKHNAAEKIPQQALRLLAVHKERGVNPFPLKWSPSNPRASHAPAPSDLVGRCCLGPGCKLTDRIPVRLVSSL